MNRKIFYVDCYYEGEKERNIGFVKVEEEGLFLMLRGVPLHRETVCKVYVGRSEKDRRYLTKISLQNGYGQEMRKWSKDLKKEDCREIYIPIDQKRYGRCVIEQQAIHNAVIGQKRIQPFSKDKVTVPKDINMIPISSGASSGCSFIAFSLASMAAMSMGGRIGMICSHK